MHWQADLYPRSQIDIFIHWQVLQQDLLQACINVTTLALINGGIPMIDFVCCYWRCALNVDLTSLEESERYSWSYAQDSATR